MRRSMPSPCRLIYSLRSARTFTRGSTATLSGEPAEQAAMSQTLQTRPVVLLIFARRSLCSFTLK